MVWRSDVRRHGASTDIQSSALLWCRSAEYPIDILVASYHLVNDPEFLMQFV